MAITKENEEAVKQIVEESFLKEYLESDTITDISYNGTELFVQDNVTGRYKTKKQPTYEEVETLGKKIADKTNHQWTQADPVLDTEFHYYRVNFVHDAASPYGCTFALRVSKPRQAIASLKDLADEDVEGLLKILVQAELGIIVSGRTGSGKTELQKSLVGYINDMKKITLIEDTMDSHLKKLYPTKDINSFRVLLGEQRQQELTYQDLIKASLRNNPDYIIVAETRGSEAYDMLQASMTDHAIITTIHATGAEAIPSRLLSMIAQDYDINESRLGADIVKHLRFGVHMSLEMMKDGIKRFIGEVVEFVDFQDGRTITNVLYREKKTYDAIAETYHSDKEYGSLSRQTKEHLHKVRLSHLVPSVFMEEEQLEVEVESPTDAFVEQDSFTVIESKQVNKLTRNTTNTTKQENEKDDIDLAEETHTEAKLLNI